MIIRVRSYLVLCRFRFRLIWKTKPCTFCELVGVSGIRVRFVTCPVHRFGLSYVGYSEFSFFCILFYMQILDCSNIDGEPCLEIA